MDIHLVYCTIRWYVQFGNSAHVVKVVKGDTQWWLIIYQWKCISSWQKICVVDLWYNRGIQKRIFTASFPVTGGFCVWRWEVHGVSLLWNYSHRCQYTNVIVIITGKRKVVDYWLLMLHSWKWNFNFTQLHSVENPKSISSL